MTPIDSLMRSRSCFLPADSPDCPTHIRSTATARHLNRAATLRSRCWACPVIEQTGATTMSSLILILG